MSDKYIIKYIKNESKYLKLSYNDDTVHIWDKKPPRKPMREIICTIIVHAINLTFEDIKDASIGVTGNTMRHEALLDHVYTNYPNLVRHITDNISEQIRLNRKNNVQRYIYHIEKQFIEDIKLMEGL